MLSTETIWWEHFGLWSGDLQVLRLRFEVGHTVREIGGLLGMDVREAGTRLRRGLRTIRRRWKEKGLERWQLA